MATIGWNNAPTAEEMQAAADLAAREAFKAARAEAVAAIAVTTASGRTFDGDELAQGRMAQAILGLQVPGAPATVAWVLADNTAVEVSAEELGEALKLAGAEQARLWVAGDE